MPDFVLVDILRPLRYFEKRYNYINSNPKCKFSNAMKTTLGIFYSKAAILELCGWMEESLDDMFKKFANLNIVNPVPKNAFLISISKTSGFEYDKYLYRLLRELLSPSQLRKYNTIIQ
jgi:hypothetical protein